MVCPSCGETLLMTERLSVQIDYCPKCRGIWLDRGELEKIIDRVEQEAMANRPAAAAPQPVQPAQPARQEPPSAYIPPMPVPPAQAQVVVVRHDDDDDYYKYGHKHKKRKHWLGEVFDFD